MRKFLFRVLGFTISFVTGPGTQEGHHRRFRHCVDGIKRFLKELTESCSFVKQSMELHEKVWASRQSAALIEVLRRKYDV